MTNSNNNSFKNHTPQRKPPKGTAHIHNNYESFYTLFHANPIPTLLTRLEDNVVMNANQALLDYLNLPHEAVIGHTAQEFNLGLNLQSQQRAALTTQLLKDGNIRNFEEEIELPSGKCKTVLTSIQYIYIEEKDAIISTFIDISERVQAEQKIRKLSIDLTTAEQEERYRISQVLHDDLQQRIFAIKMQLENAAEALRNNNLDAVKIDFAKLDDWLAQAIGITRQLSADLSPLNLKGEVLPEVILWLASQMKEQYGLEVEMDFDDGPIRLENNIQLLLLHAVRELLFNVVKHSGTLKAKVSIKRKGEDRIKIFVSDEGVGFNAESLLQDVNLSHGLTNLQQRLALFGCGLELDSRENRGTKIAIDCPLENPGL